MPESLADIDLESLDPFRASALLSCFVIGASYLLPWATVDGPGGEVGDGGGYINLSTAVQGPISPREIALFPELVVGVAVAAGVLAALRWTVFWQFVVGVLGLGGGFVALVAWAFVDASGSGPDTIVVGPYAAIPSAFEPAIGLYLAIVGSLGLVACGFAAATRTYVRIKELDQ